MENGSAKRPRYIGGGLPNLTQKRLKNPVWTSFRKSYMNGVYESGLSGRAVDL